MVQAPTDAEQRAVTKRWVRDTFDRAAAHFDDEPLSFWDACGRRTVELAGLRPGDRVLDLCCGTGSSALPAAARVGPSGRVLGLDLAGQQLRRARRKAAERGLTNVRFVAGDLDRVGARRGRHDAVLCVHGVYFAPDLPAALAGMWRRVAPGGVLAVTTWGARALEPANSLYLQAVAAVRPELRPARLSWERINTPDGLTGMLRAAGLPPPVVDREELRHPATAEDSWRVVLGSGYRLLVDLMSAPDAARVRAGLISRMRDAGATGLVADVLYARVRKPGT